MRQMLSSVGYGLGHISHDIPKHIQIVRYSYLGAFNVSIFDN